MHFSNSFSCTIREKAVILQRNSKRRIMKKIFLAFMLAIVSGVWMTSKAACMAQAPNNLPSSYITVSGTIQSLGYPCEEGEECPPCLTWAIVTSDKTYYLSTSDRQVQEFLDHMENAAIPAMYPLPLQAKATGIPYTRGSFDFLAVNDIDDLYVVYFSSALAARNSLCDEWNIAQISSATGPQEEIHTIKAFLEADTVIETQNYVKLIEGGMYKGALRKTTTRYYYIPAGSTHEYLLYAFNSQVGDQLDNLWIGGIPQEFPDGWTMTIEGIQETYPRTFVLSTGFTHTEEGIKNDPLYTTWIEGVGLFDGPAGQPCPAGRCACSCGQVVLCAYKNGEQVYVSEMGEQYGCEYNDDEQAVDTIPIYYTRDDPGSSTVDPVDPNQVVVTLKGDELTIKDYSGETITYSVKKESGNNASRRMPMYEDTFQDSVSVELTEEGQYRLDLTNPNWDYRIYGTFRYPHSTQDISDVAVPACSVEKMLRDGELLIRKGNAIYTVTGIRVE